MHQFQIFWWKPTKAFDKLTEVGEKCVSCLSGPKDFSEGWEDFDID